MSSKLIELLDKGKPLLWDGGMGSQLIARGLQPGMLPELWNVDRPDIVREIHSAYFAAGAVAVQSNTFGGHPLKLESCGLAGRCGELNREGMKRVVEARPAGKLAVGDIGPCGAMLPPTGTADPVSVKEGFRRQAFALAEGGADALHIETMFDLEEIKLAIEAALETGLDVMASMTFDRTPRGFFTIMGTTPERAAKSLKEYGAVVLGANCSVGPEDMIEVVRQLKKAASTWIIAQANAGKPRIDGTDTVYDITPEQYASFAVPIIEAGANIIGGCCGTTPQFIAAINKIIGEKY